MSQTDLAVIETAAETVVPTTGAVTFIDLVYKVRTLVLPDGCAFAIERSRIVATDPALIEYLDQHPDFTREG